MWVNIYRKSSPSSDISTKKQAYGNLAVIPLVIYSGFLRVGQSTRSVLEECNYNIQTQLGPILWLIPKHIRDGAFSDAQTSTTDMEEA